jgi:hypothetical protein
MNERLIHLYEEAMRFATDKVPEFNSANSIQVFGKRFVQVGLQNLS